MMKRLVSWLFFIALGLAGLLLVLPGMIDWSRHKDLLISEMSARLGQDIRIDGDVSLRLLPNPHLNLEQVSIGSAEKDRYLVSLQSLDARMSMDQLLHGQFVIDQIHLQEPVINIAVDKNGSNWQDFWAARAKMQEGGSGKMVALKQVTVSRASIAYHNHVTGQKWAVPRLNMTLTADSIYGPYQARGDAVYGEAPLTFTLSTQARDAQGGLPFALDVTPIEDFPQTKISGIFAPLSETPLSMDVDARDGAPASLFAPFDDLASMAGDVAALADKGQISFKLKTAADALTLSDIKANAVSGATLAGDATYSAQRGALDVDVTLTRPKLYWLSYDGGIDLVRKQRQGKIGWKIEDASKLVKDTPALSLEAAGDFTYTSPESWTLANAKLSLPQWQDVAFDGQLQRVNGQTAFALASPQVGIASNVALNGQVSQTVMADGTATLFGQTVALQLSGAAVKPDVSLKLTGINAQDVVLAINAAVKDVTLAGGSAEFKGQLDMQAQSPSQSVVGNLTLAPQTITIANFTPAALQSKILALDTVPDDLGAQLHSALTSDEGSFAAKSVNLTLPLGDAAWSMKGLSYEGGSFDFGTAGGEASVIVTASDDTKVTYKGKLPLAAQTMPVERATALILERHPPAPEVDTKATIGDILNRLDDGAVTETPAPAADDVATDEVVIKPPAVDEQMPPQPAPPLQEIEVAPAPALPEDTPLAVDIPPEPEVVDDTQTDIAPVITDDVPDEIFPVEGE